jgi:nitrogen fixation/metabolism regulation signal transduction histidine kinase
MKRLRDRLILLFLAATVLPVAATVWLGMSLLDISRSYSAAPELAQVADSLERTAQEFYRQSRETLKVDALAGRASSHSYTLKSRDSWPAAVGEFWDSQQSERFRLGGAQGDHLEYLVRRDGEVAVFTRPLGVVAMDRIAAQLRQARRALEEVNARNLRRGFLLTFLLLTLSAWIVPLGVLIYLAARISRPIQNLTSGLAQLAAGNQSVRVTAEREDEVGTAIHAFNHMAEELERQRTRLVHLTQLASWQVLARKMAHELKNSLTPIRLTMEEMVARAGDGDRAFTEQAAGIVIEEVDSLERRVRAFSQFATEPPTRPQALDIGALAAERVEFLKSGHPDVTYELRLAQDLPKATADADLVKGILTNLIENAAEAAGSGGRVLISGALLDGKITIEVHDSGPGLSQDARKTLFEPTISFKKHGMGLGLSIVKKSALMAGGDILLVKGELGGAGFRVWLPRHAQESHSSR